MLVVRNRVAPQRHRGGRALLCRGIVVLPNFRSVELRLDRNVLFNGSAIVAQGDIIGAVVLLSKDEKNPMSEVEIKLAQSAAGFLGKQIEQ